MATNAPIALLRWAGNPSQPHSRVISRAELERLGPTATSHHLDGLLHELVAAHWLMPVPAQEQPCCADGFLLRQDTEA